MSEDEFDASPNTSQIVKSDLLPKVARHGKAIQIVAGLVAAVFLAGVSFATCSSKYELASVAQERGDRQAGQLEAMKHAIELNARDTETLKAVIPYLQHQMNRVEAQVDKIADKVRAEKVPRDGR